MVLSCYIVNPSSSLSRLIFIFRPFPMLLCLCCPYHLGHPRSLEVQPSLLPLPLGHPHSWPPFCLQSNLQYRKSHNILGYSVLVAEKLRLHILRDHRRHILRQQWILQYFLSVAPGLHPHPPAGHSVVDTTQGLDDPGGNHPCL